MAGDAHENVAGNGKPRAREDRRRDAGTGGCPVCLKWQVPDPDCRSRAGQSAGAVRRGPQHAIVSRETICTTHPLCSARWSADRKPPAIPHGMSAGKLPDCPAPCFRGIKWTESPESRPVTGAMVYPGLPSLTGIDPQSFSIRCEASCLGNPFPDSKDCFLASERYFRVYRIGAQGSFCSHPVFRLDWTDFFPMRKTNPSGGAMTHCCGELSFFACSGQGNGSTQNGWPPGTDAACRPFILSWDKDDSGCPVLHVSNCTRCSDQQTGP